MTPRRYYDEHVVPNLEDFTKNKGSVRHAQNAALAAFQLADHVHEFKKGDSNWPYKNGSDYKRYLNGKCPSFVNVQSAATAHKHLYPTSSIVTVSSAGAFYPKSSVKKPTSKLGQALSNVRLYLDKSSFDILFQKKVGSNNYFCQRLKTWLECGRMNSRREDFSLISPSLVFG